MPKQKLKKKNIKNDPKVLSLTAPVILVPDRNDKPTPVLTDRYFMDDIFKYFEKNNVVLKDHWFEEGKIMLRFPNKHQAMIFKLKFNNYENWRDDAVTVGMGDPKNYPFHNRQVKSPWDGVNRPKPQGYFDTDYRPDPFAKGNIKKR